MRQRVMARYFEDVSVMMTINMMTFAFRVVLAVSFLAFTLGTDQDQVVQRAATMLSLPVSQPMITSALIITGGLGLLLLVGLFTRIIAILSLISLTLWTFILGWAWLQGIMLFGNNTSPELLDPVTTYLPLMIYSVGFAFIGAFLLMVPVYALEFLSLDGKFFATPPQTSEGN